MTKMARALFFVVVIILLAGNLCAAEEEEEDRLYIVDCKKIMGRIAKKMVKAFSACTKEVQANSTKEDFPKKMNCITKCTLGKMGLLTDDGLVTKETVQRFMDEMIPEEAHEVGHTLVEHCIEDHGLKLDQTKEFCEDYGEFTACVQNVFGELASKVSCDVGGIFGR